MGDSDHFWREYSPNYGRGLLILGQKIRWPWFTWWLNNLPGISIYFPSKDTYVVGSVLSQVVLCAALAIGALTLWRRRKRNAAVEPATEAWFTDDARERERERAFWTSLPECRFGLCLGPPVLPFCPCFGEGSRTKVDYRKKRVPLL